MLPDVAILSVNPDLTDSSRVLYTSSRVQVVGKTARNFCSCIRTCLRVRTRDYWPPMFSYVLSSIFVPEVDSNKHETLI